MYLQALSSGDRDLETSREHDVLRVVEMLRLRAMAETRCQQYTVCLPISEDLLIEKKGGVLRISLKTMNDDDDNNERKLIV